MNNTAMRVKIDPKAHHIPLHLSFEDGCTFLMAGEKKDTGWEVSLPGGFRVTCPHGEVVEVLAPEDISQYGLEEKVDGTQR